MVSWQKFLGVDVYALPHSIHQQARIIPAHLNPGQLTLHGSVLGPYTYPEGKSGEGKVRDDQRGRMEQAGKAMIGKT